MNVFIVYQFYSVNLFFNSLVLKLENIVYEVDFGALCFYCKQSTNSSTMNVSATSTSLYC